MIKTNYLQLFSIPGLTLTSFSPLWCVQLYRGNILLSIMKPKHKQQIVAPAFLFNQLNVFGGVVLCCFVLNHQFLYFDKAAFHASAAADSSSCVRDGTRWRALEAVVMRPLRVNKGLHCCHVKASYPRRAILHKARILCDSAPQTRPNPNSGVFPVTQANVGFGRSFLFLKH